MQTPTPDPVAPPLLEVQDLEVFYASHQALFGASLSVPEHAVVAVLGANGAGKSTLARTISGLVKPSAGTIVFDGEEITGRPAHQISRKGLIYVPEGRGIFPGLSVAENLRLAVRRAEGSEDRKSAIDRMTELFPVLGQRRSQRAGSLSGGEQQMLALSMALAVTPRLIVADEMSLGLAPLIIDEVFEALDRARATGVTVLLIEQFVHRALAVADECIILQQGQTVWSGPASEAAKEALERYLGEVDSDVGTIT